MSDAIQTRQKHVNTLTTLIDGRDDDTLGRLLTQVRDYLAGLPVVRPEGEPHGCSDTSPPTAADEYTMSRILDVIDVFKATNIDYKPWWDMLPYAIKLDMNYAKWQYQPINPKRKSRTTLVYDEVGYLQSKVSHVRVE